MGTGVQKKMPKKSEKARESQVVSTVVRVIMALIDMMVIGDCRWQIHVHMGCHRFFCKSNTFNNVIFYCVFVLERR